jgi:hypothetical protein
MKEVRILLYRNSKKTWYDKVISTWQRILGFERYDITHTEYYIDGYGYSSSFRDGGVRKKRIKLNKNWEYITLLATDEQIGKLKEFFEMHEGKGYDTKNIFLNKILGLNRDNPDKWICSEYVCSAVKYAGLSACPYKASMVYPPELRFLDGRTA